MQLTQFLRRAVQTAAHRTAIIDGDHSMNWPTLLERVARLAGALQKLGIGHDDRVAMLGHSSYRSIEAHFATFWAGGMMVPINYRLSLGEMLEIFQDAEPKVLLLEDQFIQLADAIKKQLPDIKIVLIKPSGAVSDGFAEYENLIEQTSPIADAGRRDEDAACLYYTGGTTGKSKGVVLSHKNIIANGFNFIAETQIDQDTVHLHCGPLYHVAAGARLFSVTMVAGTHVVLPRFDAAQVLQEIARSKVSLATFVPTMAKAILDRLAVEEMDLSSLNTITYGAAPMPEELLLRLMAALPKVRLVQLYGQTELSPVATMLGHHYHVTSGPNAGKLRSAGKAAISAEIMIVDGDDQPLPTGVIGEILVRGPMVMREYWKQPELTAQVLRGGWMHTGDGGYVDADGFLFVVDRLKDMIVTGGENVYSVEVENAVYRNPAVSECAVFGIPDPQWGEAVHAVVVPIAGVTLDPAGVIAHCKTLIAGYKCPRSVEIRTTPLPLSGANKILKTVLREPYWHRSDISSQG